MLQKYNTRHMHLALVYQTVISETHRPINQDIKRSFTKIFIIATTRKLLVKPAIQLKERIQALSFIITLSMENSALLQNSR